MSKTGLKVVYVDMDDVLCDFLGAFNEARISYPEIQYPQSQPGFFENLEPISGALEAYRWLSMHPSADTYILSAPSVMNPHSYTEKRLWIERHLGMSAAHRLILSPNKALNLGDYLVDDYLRGKGQENFSGELIHFGSEKYPDWPTVLQYLTVGLHE